MKSTFRTNAGEAILAAANTFIAFTNLSCGCFSRIESFRVLELK